ncbi:hypothetical protein ACA910_000789 [Epithemia clementina (nom. ined.)]
MQQPKSRLEAMRMQERYYECCDYTGKFMRTKRPRSQTATAEPVSSPSVTTPTMVHLLLNECASLVTDPITRITSDYEEQRIWGTWNDYSLNSPSCVIHGFAHYPVHDPNSLKVSPTNESSSSSQQENRTILRSPREAAPLSEDDEYIPSNPEMMHWRLQMFDWVCLVVEHSRIGRSSVLATAFNLLDRYTALKMKHRNIVTQEDYQLYAMTALYIAVKVLEPYPHVMGVETFSGMSRDFYQPQDIAITELEMLSALQWRTTPPTAIDFCRELVESLMPDADESGVDMEQIYPTICDVSVADPSFLNFSTSVVAVAALLHAARLTGRTRREQVCLKKGALEALGLGKVDKSELLALELVYEKIERLYC